MFAVIKTGGKQYVVKEGDVLSVEKLNAEAGQKLLFDQVLLLEDGEQTLIGTPILEKAVVKAEVVKNYKNDKILVFKKKRRKQYRRTRGHRQPLTEIRIEKIYPDKTAVPADELKIEIVKKLALEAAPAPVQKAKAPAKKEVPAEARPKAKVAPAAKPKARAAKAPAQTKHAKKPKTKTKKTAK
jgi:large subunit ribosomal protein L21